MRARAVASGYEEELTCEAFRRLTDRELAVLEALSEWPSPSGEIPDPQIPEEQATLDGLLGHHDDVRGERSLPE